MGAVFSIEASRLARNGREWHTLLEFCSIVGALLIDAEAIYDPRLTNDQLLLGMKGTISEMEVATFRERAQAALLQKAQRGALVRRVAIGYVKGADDRMEKDPDARVRAAIDLIFRKFAELGSARQVYFWLDQQQIQLPIVRGPEDAQRNRLAARAVPRGAQRVEEPDLCRGIRLWAQQDGEAAWKRGRSESYGRCGAVARNGRC